MYRSNPPLSLGDMFQWESETTGNNKLYIYYDFSYTFIHMRKFYL